MKETVSWGWVAIGRTLSNGMLACRPAYRQADDTIVYSPENAGGWRDAPADIAGTYVHGYDVDSWRPNTVPAGWDVIG